ncbi:MAG: response regulator [Candidatus Kapabacteria bacterium]|nr:response regulator [Ignavibacteriota bacterium]MCW5885271.1 response regulator [Candidatus Kapabacteria bacterium]
MSENKSVCIIEDNFPIRKLFSSVLKKNNYNVQDFDNARDGINWLRSNKPDVILLDILLPEINGWDALKIIRQIDGFESLPVIAVSGFTSESDKARYIQAGFNGFMSKPVNVSTFAEEVNAFINN